MDDKNAREILQSHGFKITFQRLSILKYLMTHKTHPTAEMIHADLTDISLATFYNTLGKFVNDGIVIVIDTHQDEKRHYDFYGEPHYHIINNVTKEIIDADNFDVEPLFKAAREVSGLNITGFHIEVYGVNPEDAK